MPPCSAPPAVTLRGRREHLSRAQNVGSPVAATDADATDTLSYTLEGADKDAFDIVSTSGQIRTKTGVTYDYEAQASYSVSVKADDGSGTSNATATAAVTIDLTDVDEPPLAPDSTGSRRRPRNLRLPLRPLGPARQRRQARHHRLRHPLREVSCGV